MNNNLKLEILNRHELIFINGGHDGTIYNIGKGIGKIIKVGAIALAYLNLRSR